MQLRHLRTVFWIAFFLLAIELALEVRAARRGWEAPLLGKPPGWNTQPAGGFGPTEAFPFRSALVTLARTAGTGRVWIASSSYGADLQLEPDRIFPNLLGRDLTAAGHPTETLNASVDGYSIVSNLMDLRARGAAWDPDVVILYQMSNDIDELSEVVLSGASAGGASGGSANGGAGPIGGAEAAERPNPIHRFVEETTVYKHLKSIVTSRLTRRRVLCDSLGAQGAAVFEGRLREFLGEVRSLGARPVLCTFATSHLRANLDELPSDYELNLMRFNLRLSLEGWLDSVERFNRVIERVAREEDVLLVDLAGELAGRSELFRDFWHMRAPGHEIAAHELAEALAATFEEDGQ